MRYRQVHLDFHTSEFITGIGKHFEKESFQENLLKGHVNSVTVFAKCAHGWSYYNSYVTPKHPSLEFDLLKEMIDAAHEINVKTPVYISVGLDEKEVMKHPEWLIRGKDDKTTWVASLLDSGWHRLCLNNAYQELLLKQIEEVVINYDLDALFFDISSVIPCICNSCKESLLQQGKNPLNQQHIWQLAESTFMSYTSRIEHLVHSIKPGLPIFHNGGHILRGRRDLIACNTHLELESLPTGGWGYDHLPLSALYAKNLGKEYLGMTGKFHTSWGEFGGFKHPNGLLYETSQCLTFGAKCSIGDQMHPSGVLDEATYRLIGNAYAEVEKKEKYLANTKLVTDIAILSLEAIGSEYGHYNLTSIAELETLGEDYYNENLISQASRSDVGAFRLLKECGFLFDIIDTQVDFTTYKIIIIPDYGVLRLELAEKLNDFIRKGGRLFLSGNSGILEDTGELFMDLGYQIIGKSDFSPIYISPEFTIEGIGNSSFIVYGDAFEFNITRGKSIAHFEAPYFNREGVRFCSHLHAPSSQKDSGPAIFINDNCAYIGFRIFEDYKTNGAYVVKELFRHTIEQLLGSDRTLKTNLPSEAVTTLMNNSEGNYYLQQVLYAVPKKRGNTIEVIEDIVPIFDITVEIKVPNKITCVKLVPQDTSLDFIQTDNTIIYSIPKIDCHQMIFLGY